MGGALRRPWRVGGPFRTWESFLVLWELNIFFLVSKIPASHWCLGVPPSPLLNSSVLYYRTYCCTAVLVLCYYFVISVLRLHTEDDTAPINLLLSAIPAGNRHTSGLPLEKYKRTKCASKKTKKMQNKHHRKQSENCYREIGEQSEKKKQLTGRSGNSLLRLTTALLVPLISDKVQMTALALPTLKAFRTSGRNTSP